MWHMFYQRTPNGPFKTQMHWGHMVSPDLIRWRNVKDALRPELQTDTFGYDQKGIWSGDVITDGGKAFAFYTSVNHSDRIAASNPGVAMAVSEDATLENWEKKGLIINSRFVNDFRDPYLFRSGGTWHMIIGAALASGGGLDYWVLEQTATGGRWDHRENFASARYSEMDIGSVIWEMPVFEQLDGRTWILSVAPIGGQVSKYGQKATRSVYWTGTWNGTQFTPFNAAPKPLDILPGHIAPTVERASDGRIRAIGIVDERRTPQAQEDAGWAQTFGFPKVWSLMDDGRTLRQQPAPELAALRGAPEVLRAEQPIDDSRMSIANAHHAVELEVELVPVVSGAVVGIELLALDGAVEATRFEIDTDTGRVTLDKSKSTLEPSENEGPQVVNGTYDAAAFGAVENIRVFVDGSVVEVFINDAATFSFRSYPTASAATNMAIFASGGPVSVKSATLWPLRLPD
jgi:sucrose-6-phosphate hydrolase SacC (GH32 family)